MAPDGLLFDLPKARAPGRPTKRRKPPVRPLAATAAGQPWPLNGEINVVLFAGMGGACQGIEAGGFPIHLAVNHDAVAIAAHKALNPHTRHIHADIYEVCPLDATGGRAVNILWASPDCRDHSVAKGGAPRSPRVRSMPWQICRWVGVLKLHGLGPRIVFLENVREIRGWGPLKAKRDKATGRVVKLDGTVAAKGERVPVREQQLVRDPKRAGRTYRRWVRHLQGLGVDYQDRDLCCADYGVPTTRKRLFGVGTLDGTSPAWPAQTHAHRKSEDVAAGRLLPRLSAGEHVIDWSLPIPSIFDRKKELVRATKRRIAVGFKRFVMDAERPFLVHLTHHGDRAGIDTADAPPTFTGAHRGEMAIVAPGLVPTTHSTSPNRVHDGGDGVPTLTAGVKGGEFAVMGAQVVFRGDSPGVDMRDGLPTVTANSYHKRPGGSVPLGVTGVEVRSAGGWKYPLRGEKAAVPEKDVAATIAAHLTRYHGERRPGEQGRGAEMDDPLPTSTVENRFGVVAASMIQTGYGERLGQDPRALDIQDGIGTQVAGGAKHAVVGAWMVKNSTDVVGLPMDDSASSIVTKEGPQAIGGAFVVHQRGTGVPSSPEDAARTLATGGGKGGDHVGIAAAWLTEYYGSGGQYQAVDDALNTLSTVDRFGRSAAYLADPPLTEEQFARARQVADFLREFGVWDGGDVVVVGPWIVVDIGMRMLRPHEAARAHGLALPPEIEIDGKRRPLTKTEAMRLVGNSVPALMALLLVRSNQRHALAPVLAGEAAE